jgi:hypothetical protein
MRLPSARPSLRTIALVCGLFAIGFLALRPPWTVDYGVKRKAEGHAWLWDPPRMGSDPRVDWSRLGCEWVAFAAAAGIAVVIGGRGPRSDDASHQR